MAGSRGPVDGDDLVACMFEIGIAANAQISTPWLLSPSPSTTSPSSSHFSSRQPAADDQRPLQGVKGDYVSSMMA
jgi:hypothetical protein